MTDLRIQYHLSSPNFSERVLNDLDQQLSLIIIHTTDMISAELSLKRLCDTQSEVSAHYLIDYDGTIYQLVDETKRAWHAGVSEWQILGKKITDINSHSIGIELQNRAPSKPEEFPKHQINALEILINDIKQRWPIIAILGHDQIAPERKKDPGELFPWSYFRPSRL